MLKIWTTIAAASLVSSACLLAAPVPSAADGTSISVPVESLRFYQNKFGLTFADAWGDPAAGAHSNYIKLAAKSASPLHIHTLSYYGVVINGTVSNERQDAPDRSLAAGSYWFQTGGEPHVTKCLSTTDCLIFVTSSGPFDIAAVSGSPAVHGTEKRPRP